jgi:hypothetical protein
MRPNKQKQFIYALSAPAILVLIASVQLFMAHGYHLTPWKGGGFGMFSTVDSQGARFLRIYLITPNGRTPVEIPAGLQPLAREVRTLPSAERLDQLANQLAQATWVPYTYNGFEQGVGEGQTPVVIQEDDPLPNATGQAVHAQQPPNDPPIAWVSTDDRPLFRTLRPDEPAPLAPMISVAGLKLELWRFRFDAQARRITTEKLVESKVHVSADHSQ